jgi:excisionase family DNA binding protein
MTKPETWNRDTILGNVPRLRRLASSEPERFGNLVEWWTHVVGELEPGELDALLYPDDASALLTIPRAATRLGVSPRTIRREVAAGRLPVVRIRSTVRIAATALTDYQNSNSRRIEEICLSLNGVTHTGSRSRSAASELDNLLAKAPRGNKRKSSKRRSAETSMLGA